MVRPFEWTPFLLQVCKSYSREISNFYLIISFATITHLFTNRNQAEMAHTCRGTISLVSAVIHTEDSCNFVISNGGTQTFHLRAGSEVERLVHLFFNNFSI